jgi:hypothetical protein
MAVGPTVTIDPGPTVAFNSIEGTGTVDPGDQGVGLYVEYATDPGGPWSEQSLGDIPANAGPTPVSYEITGLAPETQYYIRLDAWTGAYNLSSEITATTLATPDVPGATIDPPSSVTGTTAHFSGEVDTATGSNPADATWRFQCLPECSGLSGGLVTAGNSATVEADATGLLPATTYAVSLVAEGPGGQQIAGPESFTTLTVPPAVDAPVARGLLSEAIVEGKVNPGGAETSYRFEYGPSAAYGHSTETKTVGSGVTPIGVKARISGLATATTYHYRLVATNSAGTTAGPDRTFRTESPQVADSCPNKAVREQQSAEMLPDCRAYEQVSPADKNNYPVYFFGTKLAPQGLTAAATNGTAVAFNSYGSFADSEHAIGPQTYRARRAPDGWVTRATTLPPATREVNAVNFKGNGLWQGATPSLDYGLIFTDNQWSPNDHNESVGVFDESGFDAYLSGPDGKPDVVSVGADGLAVGGIPGRSGLSTGSPQLISDDGSVALFTTFAPATPEDNLASEVPRLYVRSGGTTRLVGIAPDGVGLAGGACGAGLPEEATTGHSKENGIQNALSSDGHSVVFTSPPGNRLRGYPEPECDPEFGFVTRKLFVRLNPTRPQSPVDGSGSCTAPADACTLEVSASQRTEADSSGPSEPQFVRASADGTRILFTSTTALTDDAPANTPGTEKLYEFNTGTKSLRLILEAADLRGLLKVSADARRIYFVSTEARTPGAVVGLPNIYSFEAGVTRYVGSAESSFGLGEILSNLVESHDGRALLFIAPDGMGVASPGTNPRVYLYRDGAGLACISCSSAGAGIVDNPELALGEGTLTGTGDRGKFASSLDGTGTRAVFLSKAALVPTDHNNRRDIYFWEAAGTGSCESEAVGGGCLSLITPASDSAETAVLGISRDGRDLFFGTTDGLAPQDTDDGDLDIYDARSEGGFLAPAASSPPTPCEGDACQGQPPAPPGQQGAASAALTGAGDARARRPHRRCARKRGANSAVPSCRKARKHKRGGHRQARRNRDANRNLGGAK